MLFELKTRKRKNILSQNNREIQQRVIFIDSFVSKRNMEEFSVVIMKRFRSNWFEKTKGRHITYNTRQSHPNVKKASKPRTLQDTFNDLLSNIQKPLGIHHIRTILFSLPVNYLKDLRDFGLVKGGVYPFRGLLRYSSMLISCNASL
jgi:hypothetical protein